MKEILTCKTSVVIVVCPLKSIVQDQITEAYSVGLTAVSLANNCLEERERKISACLCVGRGDYFQVVSFVSQKDRLKKDLPELS